MASKSTSLPVPPEPDLVWKLAVAMAAGSDSPAPGNLFAPTGTPERQEI